MENQNKKGYEHESFRMLGKDDVYSCGETMGWVAERIGSPSRRVVASEDRWRWRKKRLEDMISKQELEMTDTVQCEMRKEEYEGRDIGPAEAMLGYLKKQIANNSCPTLTVYALCQTFYELTQGQTHSSLPESCGIGRCILCYSTRLDQGKNSEAESCTGGGIEDWAAAVKILESNEIGTGKTIRKEEVALEEEVGELDKVFGQAGGYPT